METNYTSRERVIRAIEHKPIDRVPIDLGSHTATSISAFAYWNLREYLGLSADHIEIRDMVQFTPIVEEDVLEKFHCDCIVLAPRWKNPKKWSPRGKYNFWIPDVIHPYQNDENAWVVEFYEKSMRMPEGGYFFDGTWLNIKDRNEEQYIKDCAAEAERIYKDTEYFTTYTGFYGFFHEGDMDWQCKMLTDPDEIIKGQEDALEYYRKHAGEIINSMGDHIQAIAMGGDLGTQNGPAVRPAVYEKLCAPYLKKFCDFIHENSDYKIFMHSCGSIKPFMRTLIDCGVDAINPVQISAADMDPAELKKEFGNEITFWGGGCDTQNILEKGTEADVRENVTELVNIFKEGSGFVFSQVHNIMGNVPPENITAMLDAAFKAGQYE